MPFVALELRPDESLNVALYDFMVAAQKLGSSFKTLKVLGTIDLGNTQLIRFETDCGRGYVKKAAESLGRSYVVPTASGAYEGVRGDWKGLVSTTSGCFRVPALTMQATPLPAYAKMKPFRGPGAPLWVRQFLVPVEP